MAIERGGIIKRDDELDIDAERQEGRIGRSFKDLASENTASLGLKKPMAKISRSISDLIGDKGSDNYGEYADAFQFLTAKIYENREAIGKATVSASRQGVTKAKVLANTRTIGGVSFNGSTNIDLPGVNTTGNQDTTGNAHSATTLETARTIGGVSFNGTANINLPGVNTPGNQNTSGNAATATALETARTIGGVSFDGSGNINLPGVNTAGNQDTSGNADSAGKITVTADESSANHPITFIDDTTPDGSVESLKASRVVTVNPGASSITIGGLTITYTQGDGRRSFGKIVFSGQDAQGVDRNVVLNMTGD